MAFWLLLCTKQGDTPLSEANPSNRCVVSADGVLWLPGLFRRLSPAISDTALLDEAADPGRRARCADA